ncbi:hypothetical protein QOT17_005367 [Balamuthia mandrillaris]
MRWSTQPSPPPTARALGLALGLPAARHHHSTASRLLPHPRWWGSLPNNILFAGSSGQRLPLALPVAAVNYCSCSSRSGGGGSSNGNGSYSPKDDGAVALSQQRPHPLFTLPPNNGLQEGQEGRPDYWRRLRVIEQRINGKGLSLWSARSYYYLVGEAAQQADTEQLLDILQVMQYHSVKPTADLFCTFISKWMHKPPTREGDENEAAAKGEREVPFPTPFLLSVMRRWGIHPRSPPHALKFVTALLQAGDAGTALTLLRPLLAAANTTTNATQQSTGTKIWQQHHWRAFLQACKARIKSCKSTTNRQMEGGPQDMVATAFTLVDMLLNMGQHSISHSTASVPTETTSSTNGTTTTQLQPETLRSLFAVCAEAGDVDAANRAYKIAKQQQHQWAQGYTAEYLLSYLNLILSACGAAKDEAAAEQVMGMIQKEGLKPDRFTWGLYVEALAASGNVNKALHLLTQLEHHQGIRLSPSAMVALCTFCIQEQRWEQALAILHTRFGRLNLPQCHKLIFSSLRHQAPFFAALLFKYMNENRVPLDLSTFVLQIETLCQQHQQQHPLQTNSPASAQLNEKFIRQIADLCLEVAQEHCLDLAQVQRSAQKVLLCSHSLSLWFATPQHAILLLQLFKQQRQQQGEGHEGEENEQAKEENRLAYYPFLRLYGHNKLAEAAEQLVEEMRKQGVPIDAHAYRLLLQSCEKGDHNRALRGMEGMLADGLLPEKPHFISAIRACVNADRLPTALALWERMKGSEDGPSGEALEPILCAYAALPDGLERCAALLLPADPPAQPSGSRLHTPFFLSPLCRQAIQQICASVNVHSNSRRRRLKARLLSFCRPASLLTPTAHAAPDQRKPNTKVEGQGKQQENGMVAPNYYTSDAQFADHLLQVVNQHHDVEEAFRVVAAKQKEHPLGQRSFWTLFKLCGKYGDMQEGRRLRDLATQHHLLHL